MQWSTSSEFVAKYPVVVDFLNFEYVIIEIAQKLDAHTAHTKTLPTTSARYGPIGGKWKGGEYASENSAMPYNQAEV